MHHYLRALFVLAVVLAGTCVGQTSALAFDHPSALHTQADFDRMKAKVQAGAHPWIDDWNVLVNNNLAVCPPVTHPQAVLVRGSGTYFGYTENYQFAYWDTAAAYQLALRWKITGDNRFADGAITILNQWSTICTNLSGDPNIQLLEIYGYQFACAGEIMRSYTNWAPADLSHFQNWMMTFWYPMDHDFLINHQGACTTQDWANWDLCSMNSMMAIGILCDNTNLYNEALTYFKNGLGCGNIEQTVYIMYPGYLGQGQEEGRDQGHSGMDMAMLGVFCTMAYNHGDDLFAYQNNRVLSMCEYFAEFNYGYDVPYMTYGNCDAVPQTNLGGSSRGDNRPCWDLIYNHYVNLKGLSAPWSALYAARQRPDSGGYYGMTGGGYDQLGFTTLTCSLDPIVVGADPSGLTANLNGQQQVILNWWGTANATNYLVKRATTSGGPYFTIATNTANPVAYTDIGVSKTITTNLLTYTDSSVTNGTTYYYTVSALTPLGESGNAIEQSVSILPQLVAYYKFNESSGKNAADASGNGRTATLNSATFLSAGHSNNCVNMNGSMQFVTLPAGITTNLTDFTIATWVYLNGTQQWWSRLFDFGVGVTNSAGSPMRYMFLCPSAGNISFTISLGSNQTVPNNGASPAQTVSTSSGVLPINSWHHVAVTLAGTTCSIYVDGVLAGSGTITITPSQLGTTTQNCIGRSQWTADPYLIGRVDDFRIYNGALSAVQLAALVAAYPVQPPAPTNVVATVASANEIDLTWSPSDGATNYYVKRSNVSGGPYTTISVPLTQTNFSDTSLIGGKTYYYVITAINDGGATNSAPVSATTLVAPLAPTSLTATAVSSSQINLTWPASAGATSYTVSRAYFSGGAYTVIATNVAATGYTNTSLYHAVTYYYVVSAANANGVSTNSVESHATTQPLPATPSGVVATPGNLSVQLQWTDAANAASYNIKRSATSGGGYVMIASNVVAAGFQDTGLTNGTTYYYVVSAVNAVGESANSAEVSATPTDLIDWWKFDETSGNTAADSGAAGKTGTLMSGAIWIPGVINNAVHLDGTANGYVSFPSGVVSALSDFSICCWVKVDAGATWARVFDFGSGTGTYMFLAPFSGSGVVRYAITTSSGAGEQGINSPSAILTGVWHHLAVTLSGSTGVLYIDGKAVGTNSSMTLNPSSLGSTTQNYIGKSQWSDPNLTGGVDDFHIYARALSSGEIAAQATFIPPAPTGVAAIAGKASATLVWSASAGATSYNVKRSTTSGTNYVAVATVASPQWGDSGLVNGTPYYYVVSAVSAAGESANSAEASVTPNAGAATTLIWSGAVNGTWDTATANWLNSGATATFAEGNTAFFGDVGANATVNLSASRSPGNVIVNNSAVNYTIGGSAIAGTGKLLKQGSGMLTLSAANTYSGGTVISNGTIVCANASALAAGPLTLAGGTLVNSSAGQISLANNLYAYGTNQVYLSVSQNIDLSGCSMYGNGTVTWGWSGAGWSGINLPVLNYMTGGVFIIPNTPNNFIRINGAGCGNANVDWIINENTVGHVTIGFTSGTLSFGSLSGSGYLDNQNNTGNTLSIGGNNNSTTFAGSIVNGSGLGLAKVGTGTLSLIGVNSYTDGTMVNGGKLLITANSAVKGNYSVANGATLGVTNVSSSSALVSNLTMAAGSTLELQNISSTTTPLIAASNVTVNGSCTVKIIGASGLVAGNSYPLISYAGTLSGPFANLQLQMPYGWRGALVNSGNQITLANVAVVSTTPPQMNLTIGSQQLQLLWPQANTGWRLQVQTNVANAGLGTNWTDVPTAINTNQIGVPISATNGCVFFRLVYP